MPLSGFPPPDFCKPANVTAEVKEAAMIATLANVNIIRIALVFIVVAFLRPQLQSKPYDYTSAEMETVFIDFNPIIVENWDSQVVCDETDP